MDINVTSNVSRNNVSHVTDAIPRFIALNAPTKFNIACILTVSILGFLANSLLIMALCYSKKDRASTANMQIINPRWNSARVS